jgi:hypothetical protein
VADWIASADVEVILHRDLSSDPYIDGLISRAQHLAELEVGTQDSPNDRLKAVLASIVARMWQAGESARMNPAGMQSETSGPFTYQDVNAGVAGLGLTNRERSDLKKAAGISGLWIQPTSRSDTDAGIEVAGEYPGGRVGVSPDQMLDVQGGEQVPWFNADDLVP